MQSSSPPSGASKAVGGTFRGRALGNAPNIGDIDHQTPSPVERFGMIDFFHASNKPTAAMVDKDSDMCLEVPYAEHFGSVLTHVARDYSPVRRMVFFFVLKIY